MKEDYKGLTAEQWCNAYHDLHRRYRLMRDTLDELKRLIEEVK